MAKHNPYPRETVGKSFRDWMVSRFGVKPGSFEWRFLCLLFFGWRDEDGVVVSTAMLKVLENLPAGDYRTERLYTGKQTLEIIADRFPELALSWDEKTVDGRTRYARTVRFNLDDEGQARLLGERSMLHPLEDCISVQNGKQINRNLQADIRSQQLQVARTQISSRTEAEWRKYSYNNDQLMMLDYLNNLPSNLFTKVVKAGLSAAVEAVNALETEQQRLQAMDVLNAIQVQPQPFYTFSRRSTRLSPMGNNLCNLKSSIRKRLTADWIELDLKNVHLAINGAVWGIPEVQAFLATGRSWWQELFDWFGIEPDLGVKQACKERTYSLCYGMSSKNLKAGISLKEELAPELLDKFLSHSIVKAIQKSRAEQQARIAEAGGTKDAYGNWIKLDITQAELKRKKREKHEGEITESVALALAGQSYEQRLIARAFELAVTPEAQKNFRIALYQYDGISVAFTDQRRKEQWLGRLQATIASEADRLGIKTTLVV